MADSFFGFDTTLLDGIEDGLDCPLEEDDFGEEEYDALNDETFGSEATIGDWEKDHEKLAEITESSRSQHKNASDKKNGISVNIEDSLSHLVLDEKEGIVPKPGVWDSPNIPLPKPRPPPSLATTLKNVCTVEELERGLIANRPPPGLTKPSQLQQQKPEGSFIFEALSLNDKLQINGLPTSRFPPGLGLPGPHPMVMPPNLRLPHSQFMQHPRLLSNQPANVLRYPLPPHVMLPQGTPRQPIHGPFTSNFHHPPHPNLGPPQFLRQDHPMMPPFSSNQAGHQQHSFPHPGNQRNQNRLFYSNEQQGNHQPFFKNNQYLHRNHDRNNQRYYHYQHHNHPQGINGLNNSGEYDEYAGLMSSREKQWLINIQLLQLNTNQPYVDDYYYTVFCDRQNKLNANQDQKDKKHNNNNGFQKDSRNREQPQHVASKVVYIPAQFENSLGKLQFSSVTAPRKIIDMDVVPNSDPHSTLQSQQKDTKKTRQLFLEIERMYTILLKIEDLNNPLAVLSEQQQQDSETETNIVKKTGAELICMMLTSISQLIQDDKIASMLSIRKGKTLLLRFLPLLNVIEYNSQLEGLWTCILRSLAIIGRRDTHLLTNFYAEFRRWLDTVQDFNTVLRLTRALSESATQPVKNNSLVFALVNKFGVSVLAALLERAEKLYPTNETLSSDWSNFIITLVELIGDTSPCVAPCQPVAASTLNQHLSRISSLKIDRYRVLELLLTDANSSR
ncbi:protein PAT1 homolog 1 [Vespa crabro]|uniref:protein PAT1 homolog 1 n=1 Tax=Vespa crabro TaxID=7445 RepID=UPI001F02A26E|nr:protein PAT1 homolog 1 [Vespa crabro]